MKIAIIEDDKKFRECLSTSLNAFPDCTVIHNLHNALNVVESFLVNTPDIVLVDMNMPGINGIDAVATITKNFKHTKCIMLTVNNNINLVLKTMLNGAKGYLVKDQDSIVKIVESIRILHNGNYNEEFPLNGFLANKLLQHFAKQETSLNDKLDAYKLTQRQKEILKLLYDGKSYKEIAAICNIEVQTLNSHIKAIYPKLSINSRSELQGLLK